MDWEQNRLRTKYPNIRPGGFYRLACTQCEDGNSRFRHDFARFKEDLREALDAVGTVQVKFSPAEFKVLSELRRRSPKETFLLKAEYQRLCQESKLDSSPENLLDLLDKLGVVIHFPNLHRLDEFLLNPRWLTYGVYQLITREQARVSEADAYDCLSRAEVTDNLGHRLEYPRHRCGHILDAMEQFKVAYRVSEGNAAHFEIPSLLPTDEPTLDFPENQARAFRFRFDGLLPPQLLPQLIVARHADIDQGKVWRHGAQLHTRNHGGASALIRGDAYDRTLTLWITGAGLDRYFAVLYQNVKDILADMPELPCDELIRLPHTARRDGAGFRPDETEPWADWIDVLHAERKKEAVYAKHGVDYDLKTALDIMTKTDRQGLMADMNRDLHIHHHYSETDIMGDTYQINSSQVGAIGKHAKAENNTFNFQENPALADLAELLPRLLADLQNAPQLAQEQRDAVVYELQTATEALDDLRQGNERGKSRLARILGGIKSNVGPIADGITVFKEAGNAALPYWPALLAAIDVALKRLS